MGREVINRRIEITTKRDVTKGGREVVYWLIESSAKFNVHEGGRKVVHCCRKAGEAIKCQISEGVWEVIQRDK